MSGLMPPGPLSYEGQIATPFINRSGPPTTSNINFDVPTLWVDTVGKDAYLLVSKANGVATWSPIGGEPGQVETLSGNSGGPVSPDGNNTINVIGSGTTTVVGNPGTNTLTINPTSSGYPITPYVVGPVGKAGYQTIQSAITAANTAGGGVVYIQPGDYTENLTLFDAVDLYATPAVSQNQGASVSITGTHTPPTSGHVGFNSICFIAPGSTSVFSSVAAGTTHLVFLNCESAVENGYFCNLLNWTGILEFFDINPSTAGAPFAVNDGGINNTGGASLFMFGAALGSGTNVMTLSGSTIVGQSSFGCPVNFVTGSQISAQDDQFFFPVTFSNNSTGEIDTSNFYGGASAAITMSSSAAIKIISATVNSSNNPAIAGAGAGTLTLNNVSFTGNANIAGTLTLGTSSVYPVKMSNGQLLIGSTGQAAVAAAITPGTGITVTNGAGSITIATTAFSSINNQVFTTSGTYTPTAGMSYCLIQAIGGGGGAGAANTSGANQCAVGGAGGAGGYAYAKFTAAQIGASQTVTIGAGGAGSSTNSNNGSNGGVTSVGVLITAGGGGGGQFGAAGQSSFGDGGDGGSSGSGGEFKSPGSQGGIGIGLLTSEIGGAGVFGTVVGGYGPAGPFGGGVNGNAAAGSGSTNPGQSGNGFGSGGSGGATWNAATAAGGTGADGAVIITEFII